MRLVYLYLMLGIIIFFHNISLAKTHKSKSYRPQPIVLSTIRGAMQLNEELTHLIQENLTNADITVYVKSMKNGELLYARNINQPLTPAST